MAQGFSNLFDDAKALWEVRKLEKEVGPVKASLAANQSAVEQEVNRRLHSYDDRASAAKARREEVRARAALCARAHANVAADLRRPALRK